MVSGFLTSPLDQERMASGEATWIATYSTWFTFSRPSNSRAFSFELIILIQFSFAKFQLDSGQRGGRTLFGGRLVDGVGVTHLDVEAERLHFLDQHVEGFRNAGLQSVVALDNAFVNPRASLHVVGFDGEQFLQRVSGAVSFHGPDFHFAEALAAVLRLAAQRLLRDERVRPDRARVNLVRHQMAQLHHVDVANDDFLVEAFARASVDQVRLAVVRQIRLVEVTAHFLFLDAVEDRRRELHAEQLRRPAEVRFQHLSDVHARGHAQRIQNDINRSSVREKRHVFLGDDLGDDTLVTMASGHFVTDGQFALGSDVNFHRLHDAAVHAFPSLGAFHFLVVLHLQVVEFLLKAADDFIDLVADRRRIDFDAVIDRREFAQQGLGDLAIGRDDDFAGFAVHDVERNFFAEQDVAQRFRQLVAQFVGLLLVFVLDLLGLLLLFGSDRAFAVGFLLRRNLHVHDDAVGARRNLQRGVFHVRGFFTEDGAQEALFRREFGLGFRCDFADENVARLHFRADANDAVRPEVLQRFIAEVRDVARNFFRPELGVAGGHFKFIDVNRGEHVVFDDAFADEDGVLEVVAVPRHERDEHVAAERELSALRAGTVSDDLALLHVVTFMHQDFLVDAGGGVRAHEFADG